MRNYKKGILPLLNDALKSHHTSAGLDRGTQSLESSLVVQVCGIFSSSWCLIGTAGPLKNVKQLLRCFIVFNTLCLCELGICLWSWGCLSQCSRLAEASLALLSPEGWGNHGCTWAIHPAITCRTLTLLAQFV